MPNREWRVTGTSRQLWNLHRPLLFRNAPCWVCKQSGSQTTGDPHGNRWHNWRSTGEVNIPLFSLCNFDLLVQLTCQTQAPWRQMLMLLLNSASVAGLESRILWGCFAHSGDGNLDHPRNLHIYVTEGLSKQHVGRCALELGTNIDLHVILRDLPEWAVSLVGWA